MFKAANEMRKGSEPLDEGNKVRVLAFCCDPPITHHEQLVESLSSVPREEAWRTYLWLDDSEKEGQSEKNRRDFIEANLLEISGERQEAVKKYRLLQKEMDPRSTMKDSVDAAIARLSQNHNS